MASLAEFRKMLETWHELRGNECLGLQEGQKCCVDSILDEIYVLENSEFNALTQD